MPQDTDTSAIAIRVEEGATKGAEVAVKPPSFKGKIAGYTGPNPRRFESKNSEGNRFIVNSQL